MNYVQHVNARIREAVLRTDRAVLFGQNISAGSCLSGLTKGLPADDRHRMLNTPNVENALVGVGFGLMLRGVPAVFLMKQQDFLLLGIDHLANTGNFVRLRPPRASFTIVPIAVDNGYQGMQSSLNNLFDFCSIARIPGYTVANRHDIDEIIGKKLMAPGMRIIGVSQRLFGQEVLSVGGDVRVHGEGDIFEYARGDEATIACFNFSFPQGLRLREALRATGAEASLFSVNACLPCDWAPIARDAERTRRVVILDDSKCPHAPCTDLALHLKERDGACRVVLCRRQLSDRMLHPNADEFVVHTESVLRSLALPERCR